MLYVHQLSQLIVLAWGLCFLITSVPFTYSFFFGHRQPGSVWFPSHRRSAYPSSSPQHSRHNTVNFGSMYSRKLSPINQLCEDHYGYPEECVGKGECMQRMQHGDMSSSLSPQYSKLDNLRICGWKYIGFMRPLVCCADPRPKLYGETRQLEDTPASSHSSDSGSNGAEAITAAGSQVSGISPSSTEAIMLAPLQKKVAGVEDCGCVRKPAEETCPKRTGPPGEKIITFVVGGLAAMSPGDYPWMAALGEKQGDSMDWFCGGSLVSSRHVLTAAHCLDNSRSVDVVRLGEHDLSTPDEATTIDVGVEKVIRHEGYKQPQFYNDIAVLKLSQEIKFTNNIRSICLPPDQATDVPANLPLIVMGWGTDGFGGSMSGTLQFAGVPIVDRKQCNDSYQRLARAAVTRKYPIGITMDLMCAGSEGKDACQGDSGGPLVQEGTNDDTGEDIYTLYGIVSSGIRCGDPNFPGLYTRVDRYLDWIERAMMD